MNRKMGENEHFAGNGRAPLTELLKRDVLARYRALTGAGEAPVGGACGELSDRERLLLLAGKEGEAAWLRGAPERFEGFVNRCLACVRCHFEGRVPEGQIDPSVQGRINILYGKAARLIEEGNCREALEAVFGQISDADILPEREAACAGDGEELPGGRTGLYTCIQVIANAAVLLAPFLPETAERAAKLLGVEPSWGYKSVPGGRRLTEQEKEETGA